MTQALLGLQLLANRRLNPGGLLLNLGELREDDLIALATNEDFAALAGSFPCLLEADDCQRLSSGTLQSLLDAGCRKVAEANLLCAEYPPALPLPSDATWITGEWYLRPPAKPLGKQSGSRTLALKLVQLVAADADTRELEDVFRADPVLSYHLLRLVNSVGIGVGRRINSFSQAIIILGRSQLRRWLNLMLFAAGKDDPRAPMLLARAAVRSRSMELLALGIGLDRHGQDQAFMAGLFSLLGVLFGMPLEQVLNPLQISEETSAAVLRREGPLGRLLQAVEFFEQGDADRLAELETELAMPATMFSQRLITAHQWMLGVIRDLSDNTRA